MSRKPETGFIGAVNVHLPPESELHREKMANPYSSGTADVWYSGSPGRQGQRSHDLWAEYKFIELPVRPETVIDLVGGKKPILSGLQQDWLKCRYHEGRNVCVIVGCKDGGVVFTDRLWEKPITAGDFRSMLLSRKQIAAWIVDRVQGKR